MPESVAISTFQTISHLAGRTAVHRAFQWFHLQEPQLREWHRQVSSIPAPPFGEAARAEWLAEQFTALGLHDVKIDSCGNVLGWIRSSRHMERKHAFSGPCTLLSAHIDTVFPREAIGKPMQQDSRLLIPGASDNGAGITALLAIAAAIRAAGIQLESDILFAGNVGEEGEGNLRGMRHLFHDPQIAPRIRAAVVLDGAGTDTIVTQGLGSKRFHLRVTGPGGHSWSDAGMPNPILILSHALTMIDSLRFPDLPRTTWNVGRMEGGTSVNAIPQWAEARIDTRSTDASLLAELEEHILAAVATAVRAANATVNGSGIERGSGPIAFEIKTIGERPAAKLADDARILNFLHSVDRHLGIQSRIATASTDANIPLSLGIEAVSIGSGGRGGGVHTHQEWFDATGRDLALRRILLLLLALSQVEIR